MCPDPLSRNTAEAVARRSYGKLVALLAARTGDLAAAEDALSEAFVKALETWSREGCPASPEAWLMTVAKRKIIDFARRDRTHQGVIEELALRHDSATMTENSPIPDQRLAMMFACAHPAIDPAVRAPLILQAVLGFSAETIASSFLTSPATMSQRLVRAKNKIRETAIPFRVPDREELPDRLATVLDAIYAAFAEGWTDAAGTDAARRDLAEEAIFLGGLVVELLPGEPEALGLCALMLHAEARRRARRDSQGEYVPLAEQDTALWDWQMIEAAETMLRRASQFGALGRYQLEAAIQSAHVERRRTAQPNWLAVVQLYDALWALMQSPVVAINRALAIAELSGPETGLRSLPEIAADSRLAEYQPYWAARAELLAKTGARNESHDAYEIAIGLERDPAVRRFLQRRQSAARELGAAAMHRLPRQTRPRG